jgi:hypothetical protein
MRESSFPLGGHSCANRLRANDRVITRENVALQRDTQAGGLMGRNAASAPTDRRMIEQIGIKLCISGEVLLNSKRVERPNPESKSANDGMRYVYIDSARGIRCMVQTIGV